MLKNQYHFVHFKALSFNSMFKFNYFPHCSKTATLASILKPSKSTELIPSYRPFSLLDSLCKLDEVFIARQLDAFIEENNKFASEQFGFRKDLSAPLPIGFVDLSSTQPMN